MQSPLLLRHFARSSSSDTTPWNISTGAFVEHRLTDRHSFGNLIFTPTRTSP
jgi:hypothetical protein